MLRSQTVHTIRDLAAQGHSIRTIAQETGLARNTIRNYVRGTPEAAPRPRRSSKLDPFTAQIRTWVLADRLLNCETMFERLQLLGYTGSVSLLKAFVQPLRPVRPQRTPVQRYETKPGEQLQIDWGEFMYEQQGRMQKLYGFTAVLSYSRMRFIWFTKRCDTPSLIRGLMAACAYFDGVPQAVLADRMKSVLLQMDGRTPQWNPQFADFLASIGVTPRVCRPYAPQTKGKVERSIGVIKASFWPGVRFTDLDDLNQQALAWCDRRNQRVHATTRVAPLERWVNEGLRPLPTGFAWERYALEDRRVTSDGFVSFDGVLYGLPAAAQLTGRMVQVGVRGRNVLVWAGGELVVTHPRQPISGTHLLHPAQFAGVPPASTRPGGSSPLGYQVPAPTPVRRALGEYDQLCGVVTVEVAA